MEQIGIPNRDWIIGWFMKAYNFFDEQCWELVSSVGDEIVNIDENITHHQNHVWSW